MEDEKIPGGYYIKSRKIKNSPVHRMPPYVREIWDYCLREANHADAYYNGFFVRRGQLFRSYKDIREDLAWYVGYRKMMYNENHTKRAMKVLREALMIDTARELGGVLVTVLNYEFYQNPKNYESTNESTNESTTSEPSKHHPLPYNNKKKKKKEKKKESTLQNKFAEQPEEEYYKTKNGKKLTGKRLETFLRFWGIFNYKKGKAEAAQAWYDIPQLTGSLVNVICAAAMKEAQVRQEKINNGQTPKMAQGWLTARRWEDEDVFPVGHDDGSEKARKIIEKTRLEYLDD